MSSKIKQNQNIPLKSQPSDKNIVSGFRQSCLLDLKQKQQYLSKIKHECIEKFQVQSQQHMQQISKSLILFQDILVKHLRERIKLIVQYQQNRLKQQIIQLQTILQNMIQQQDIYIAKMIKIIENDGQSCSKLLGKIAQGKIEQEWKNFEYTLMGLKVSQGILQFDQQSLQDTIDDVIDTLNVKYPFQQTLLQSKNYGSSIPNKSLTINNNLTKMQSNNTQFMNLNQSSKMQNVKMSQLNNYSHISGRKSKILDNKSRLSWLKNQSAVSIKIQQKQRGDSNNTNQNDIGTIVVDEYKQTKTIKKLKRIQQKYKQKQKSPEKDLQKIAKLVLQRKRILKQLQ